MNPIDQSRPQISHNTGQHSNEPVEHRETEIRLPHPVPTLRIDPYPLLSELSAFHQEAFYWAGCHPIRSFRLFDPYQNKPWEILYPNIGEHGLATGLVARTLAEFLQSAGQLLPHDVAAAFLEGAIHDLGKGAQQIVRAARRRGELPDDYSTNESEQIKFVLMKSGVPDQFITPITNAGSYTDHPSIPAFFNVDNEGMHLKPQMLIEKCTFLANCMVSTSIPTQSEERAINTVMNPIARMESTDQIGRYPYILRYGLGVSLNNPHTMVPIELENHSPDIRPLSSYYELIKVLASQICNEFAQMGSGAKVSDPVQFITEQVCHHIDSKLGLNCSSDVSIPREIKKVLFICSGNTFRSVTAEYSLRRALGDYNGIEVASCGLEPSAQAPDPSVIEALRSHGLETSTHMVRKISAEKDSHTLLIAMTEEHQHRTKEITGSTPLLFNNLARNSNESISDVAERFGSYDPTNPRHRALLEEIATNLITGADAITAWLRTHSTYSAHDKLKATAP